MVGAVTEALGVHLRDHGEHAPVALGLALRQQARGGATLAAVNSDRRGVRAGRHAGAAADAGRGVEGAGRRRAWGRGCALASGAAPVRTRDVAAGLDDAVERAAVDDQVLQHREGAARNGSIDDLVAVLEVRMCSWQVVVAACGPCGTPLIIMPHVPQMPSRQSWSNAIGSSPFAISCSLTTSSISRNDMCSLTLGLVAHELALGRSGPVWRHTWR